MLTRTWLDYFPPWVYLVVTALVMFGAFFGGYRLAARRRKELDKELDTPNDVLIGGILGLLALLMAFTFGMSAARFDTRRQLLLDEVDAIETAYLRAGLVPEPESRELRTRLREYVRIRVDVAKQPQTLPAVLKRSEALHDEMWTQAANAAKKDPTSELTELFIDALNEVIDFHHQRMVVNAYRIPNVIWISMYLISIITMVSVGYRLGHAGTRDVTISLLLALAVSIVIFLIADLDRGYEGTVPVSQQPMIELDRKLSG